MCSICTTSISAFPPKTRYIFSIWMLIIQFRMIQIPQMTARKPLCQFPRFWLVLDSPENTFIMRGSMFGFGSSSTCLIICFFPRGTVSVMLVPPVQHRTTTSRHILNISFHWILFSHLNHEARCEYPLWHVLWGREAYLRTKWGQVLNGVWNIGIEFQSACVDDWESHGKCVEGDNGKVQDKKNRRINWEIDPSWNTKKQQVFTGVKGD